MDKVLEMLKKRYVGIHVFEEYGRREVMNIFMVNGTVYVQMGFILGISSLPMKGSIKLSRFEYELQTYFNIRLRRTTLSQPI
jgi:hypothetical protein